MTVIMRLIFELSGPGATRDLGRRLGELLQGGEVISLKGDLGAGKTTFVQGLAQGLGLSWDDVVSPTFILAVNLKGGRLELKHVDLYRLDGEEALELGLEEMMTGPGYDERGDCGGMGRTGRGTAARGQDRDRAFLGRAGQKARGSLSAWARRPKKS